MSDAKRATHQRAKKNESTITAVSETARVEVLDEQPQPQPEPEHWTLGSWHGRTLYTCRRCTYATLHEADIRQHVSAHLVQPTHTSRVGLVDQYGRPLPRPD